MSKPEVDRYIRAIRNPWKKLYAAMLRDFLMGKSNTRPGRGRLGYMAAQAVRIELAAFGLEEYDEEAGE
jgi:hypothetical protein